MYELFAIILVFIAFSIGTIPLVLALVLGILSHFLNFVFEPTTEKDRFSYGSSLLGYSFNKKPKQGEKKEDDISDIGLAIMSSWAFLCAYAVVGTLAHAFTPDDYKWYESVLLCIEYSIVPISYAFLVYGPLLALRYICRVKKYVDKHIKDETVHTKAGETEGINLVDIDVNQLSKS